MRRAAVFSVVLCVFFSQHLSAHYLFIRISPVAEAGRFADVFFSEKAAAGDPRYIDKISRTTKLWLQTTPGKFEKLSVIEGEDRMRAHLPTNLPVSVIGVCEYGVLKREVPFLLRHYPKAVAGEPKHVNAFQPRPDTPLEMTAQFSEAGVTLSILDQGKPVPQAKLKTVDDQLHQLDLTTNAAGTVLWKPETPGYYSVYGETVRKQAGEFDGTKYTEIREFATIAFRWAPASTQADPQAVKLFTDALEARAAWKEFPGFTAEVKGVTNDRPFSGTIKLDPKGEIATEISDEVAEDWVKEQLTSLVTHRLHKPASEQTPPVLSFADQELDHPLGRLLMFEGGKFASSYRIRDNQIWSVNRFSADTSTTIQVLDNTKNPDGKFLPHSYTVRTWDKAGALQSSENVVQSWTRLEKWDLPQEFLVTNGGKEGVIVHRLQFSKHKLLTK
ncbi:MAG: DUF3386 family protein [Planctomycetales bacterium]